MAQIRDILIHVSTEEAAGTRKCTRNKKLKIVKGETCLVVRTGPMDSPKSYCRDNAKPMLDNAWKKLGKIYEFLDLTPPTHP